MRDLDRKNFASIVSSTVFEARFKDVIHRIEVEAPMDYEFRSHEQKT